MLKTLQAATLVFAVATAPALAGGFDDAQRKEIGDIVRDYLLEHPEILLEVSKKLEEKQQAEETAKREDALKALAGDIFRMKGDHVAGNPEGDVTMVEFFDYNCGWCKKGMPEVLAMVEEDKNLRLVLKEFPIFGGDSDYAAKAALASQKQGKYWEFHVAMLGHEGKVEEDKNQELATALAIGGTPAFVIDNQVVPGYLPKDGLMASVNKVREQGGCKVC
jgi:protein-disulfide isomerase